MSQFVESSKRRTHSRVLGVGECLHHITLNSLFDDKLIENVAKFIKKRLNMQFIVKYVNVT